VYYYTKTSLRVTPHLRIIYGSWDPRHAGSPVNTAGLVQIALLLINHAALQRCCVYTRTFSSFPRSPAPFVLHHLSPLSYSHLLEAGLINYYQSRPLFLPRLLDSLLPAPHSLHFHSSFSLPPLGHLSLKVLDRHGSLAWLARARPSYTPAIRTPISVQPFIFPIRRSLQTHIAGFPHCKALLQCLSHHHVMYALTAPRPAVSISSCITT